MKISCGLLLTDGRKLLLCHVTGKHHWDIPKGVQEGEEEPLDTLIREVKEETGVVLDGSTIDALLDLGLFNYLPGKMLHLFLLEVDGFPSLLHMSCSSTFEMFGKSHPEVDEFDYVPFQDLEIHVTENMFKVLNQSLFVHYDFF